MSGLLEAQHVSFSYSATPTLRDISLSLEPGQIVSLLGPNGSGKSTLIKLLLGYLRGDGRILWQGRPLSSWRRSELARNIAYLSQSPPADPFQRVVETLRFGRTPYWSAFGLESARDVRMVKETSALLNLDELMDRPLDQLSGGQRQLVFLGRCLVQEPRVMLLDEPNTFLDLKHQVELLQLLRRLAKERALAILLASHDLNLAGAFADKLVLLDHGQIAAAGPPADVLREDILSRVYGLPIDRIERDGAALVFPRLTT